MTVKVAILDLYNGHPNQGMPAIEDILKRYRKKNAIALEYEIFDVRKNNELPDTSFDIYLSSGGPGSPLESGEEWEKKYFELIDALENINNQPHRSDKKHGFFICHSFQLLCRKYKLGEVVKRKSTAFGIFPVHRTDAWDREDIFQSVDNTFFAVDSRDWQVIEPNEQQFEALGARLLAIEKERPHVELERCMMAIRFNDYFFGTQFHPEADPVSMKRFLLDEINKIQVIQNHGEEKYLDILQHLDDPDKLELTRKEIIPSFLHHALNALQEA